MENLETSPSAAAAKDVEEQPSCSKSSAEAIEKQEDEDLANIVTAEEYLMRKDVVLLDYEKQMFLDTVHADALMVCAKYVWKNIKFYLHISYFS